MSLISTNCSICSVLILIICSLRATNAAKLSEYNEKLLRLAKSYDIKAYMDRRLDPCNDFYAYTCKTWRIIKPTQRDGNINTDKFQDLTKQFERKLKLLLRRGRTKNGSVENKMKDFYESCVNTNTDHENYRKSLVKLYKEIGEFATFKTEQELNSTNFKWWSTVAKIQHNYGKSIILSLYILDDIKNKSRTMVYVGAPEFELTQGALDLIDTIQEERIRKFMINYLKINKEDASIMAKNAITFENNLTMGGTDSRLGKSVEELLTLYNTTDFIEEFSDLFNATEYLEIGLGTKELPDQLYVYDKSYLENLYEVFNSSYLENVEDYVLWIFLEEYMIDIYSRNMDKDCIEKTKKYFGKYVDHAIYNQYRSAEYEREMFDLFDNIKTTFKHNLETGKYKWITNATSIQAIQKLNNMKLSINSYDNDNFVDNFKNLKINSSNYVINVQTILEHAESLRENKLTKRTEEDTQLLSFTPIYNIFENEIKIPVAVMQPFYFWNTTYPKAIQYATFGYLIAHEMIHGFDDEGRRYDANGSIHDWWDKESAEEFEKRRQCFAHQYHQYIYYDKHLPKSALQAENIADNGGINIAYDAYKRWLSQATNVEQKEVLPNLNVNNHQLFFISFAQLWCEEIDALFRNTFANADVHAPGMFRVIGSLSNSKEFSSIYKCHENSRMNPKSKCEIY